MGFFVCSYLGFGLMAGRAAVLAWEEAKAANPCILGDHQGAYEYGGMKYELVSHPAGASFDACSKLVKLVLRQNQACGAPQVPHCLPVITRRRPLPDREKAMPKGAATADQKCLSHKLSAGADCGGWQVPKVQATSLDAMQDSQSQLLRMPLLPHAL